MRHARQFLALNGGAGRAAGGPVRVAHVVTPDGVYGAERWVAAVLPQFAPDSVDALVVLIGTRPGVAEAAAFFAGRGLRTAHIGIGGKLNPRAVLALAWLLRRQRIEVAHSHGFKSDLLAYAAGRPLGVTLVTTPHGWSAPEGARIALYEAIGRLCTRRFDCVYPLSRGLERDLLARAFRRQRVRLVPNGVDDQPLAPIYHARRRAEPAGPPLIVFVGRLCAAKGVFELLDAFAAARLPAGARLVLAGSGPAQAALAAHGAGLGLDGRVQFAGYVPDVCPLLRRAHVLVLPSHSEGLPRALMEACAAGVPVVASDIPGVRELIEDQHNGLLVPARQPAALARALERVCSEAPLRRRLTEAARHTIERSFTAERQAQRFAAEYHRLARRGDGEPA